MRTAAKKHSKAGKTKRAAGIHTKSSKKGRYTIVVRDYTKSGMIGERSAASGRFVREGAQGKGPRTTTRDTIPVPGTVKHRRSDYSKEDAELHNGVALASAKSIARRA